MKSPESFERTGTFKGEVLPEWVMTGTWLSVAWKRYGGQMASNAMNAEKAFARLRDGETPESYAAAIYSAGANLSTTSGVTLDEYIWSTPPSPPKAYYPEIGKFFANAERSAWSLYGSFRYLAESTVYVLLLAGELRAYGSKSNTAEEPTWIPVRAWLDLKRDRSVPDKVFASGVIYFHVHIVDPNRQFHSDRIEPLSFRTGTAGRDTSVQLAEIQLRARAGSGEMIMAPFSEEAKILAGLVKEQYPTAPPISSKTIQNKLGPLYRELGGGRPIPK